MARSRTKISGGMIADASITSADLGQTVARPGDVDFMALKVGIQNNLTIYNLKDGIVDRYADATGIDASASTDEVRNDAADYYAASASDETTEIFTRPWTWLQFDGSDASTTFTESGVGNVNGAWGANGNAQLDTAQKKFGTASLLLDGSGDYLSGAWNRWWGGYGLTNGQRGHFANYNFTIDCWVRLTSIGGGTQCIFYNGGGSQPEIKFYFNGTNGLGLSLGVSGDWVSACYQGNTTGWSADTWHHIACVRYGNDFTLYLNGTAVVSKTSSAQDMTSPLQQAFYIGATNSGSEGVAGHIDNFRLDGLARWTGNFTVPASATEGCSTGSYTAPTGASTATVFIVAGGGGGGGSYYGGGGGSGGAVYDTAYPVSGSTSYTITIGRGGAGKEGSGTAPNGEDTVFNVGGTTMTALGGGGGGNSPRQASGSDGGSGSGGSDSGIGNAATQPASPSGGSASAVGYGNPGGGDAGGYGGTGGGGLGAQGGNNSSTPGGSPAGDGGAGREFSSFSKWGTQLDGNAKGTSLGYFGGGGGGGLYPGSPPHTGGLGGIGGGGVGGGVSNRRAGKGFDGFGAGGGSGNTESPSYLMSGGPGGAGFAGVISHPVYSNMTLVSNAQTAVAAPTLGRILVLDEASTGTTTINTDVKAYISRDNGTTYSQVTLTDDGEYATGKRMLSGSVDISGQPSGTAMRYKIETLNQSATKITRIYGTALLW